ncbi:hypothetical protein ACFLZV_05930 [Candidatus Margulisiibacteriota bacterium]
MKNKLKLTEEMISKFMQTALGVVNTLGSAGLLVLFGSKKYLCKVIEKECTVDENSQKCEKTYQIEAMVIKEEERTEPEPIPYTNPQFKVKSDTNILEIDYSNNKVFPQLKDQVINIVETGSMTTEEKAQALALKMDTTRGKDNETYWADFVSNGSGTFAQKIEKMVMYSVYLKNLDPGYNIVGNELQLNLGGSNMISITSFPKMFGGKLEANEIPGIFQPIGHFDTDKNGNEIVGFSGKTICNNERGDIFRFFDVVYNETVANPTTQQCMEAITMKYFNSTNLQQLKNAPQTNPKDMITLMSQMKFCQVSNDKDNPNVDPTVDDGNCLIAPKVKTVKTSKNETTDATLIYNVTVSFNGTKLFEAFDNWEDCENDLVECEDRETICLDEKKVLLNETQICTDEKQTCSDELKISLNETQTCLQDKEKVNKDLTTCTTNLNMTQLLNSELNNTLNTCKETVKTQENLLELCTNLTMVETLQENYKNCTDDLTKMTEDYEECKIIDLPKCNEEKDQCEQIDLPECKGNLTETDQKLGECKGNLTETNIKLTETNQKLDEYKGNLTETKQKLEDCNIGKDQCEGTDLPTCIEGKNLSEQKVVTLEKELEESKNETEICEKKFEEYKNTTKPDLTFNLTKSKNETIECKKEVETKNTKIVELNKEIDSLKTKNSIYKTISIVLGGVTFFFIVTTGIAGTVAVVCCVKGCKKNDAVVKVKDGGDIVVDENLFD